MTQDQNGELTPEEHAEFQAKVGMAYPDIMRRKRAAQSVDGVQVDWLVHHTDLLYGLKRALESLHGEVSEIAGGLKGVDEKVRDRIEAAVQSLEETVVELGAQLGEANADLHAIRLSIEGIQTDLAALRQSFERSRWGARAIRGAWDWFMRSRARFAAAAAIVVATVAFVANVTNIAEFLARLFSG